MINETYNKEKYQQECEAYEKTGKDWFPVKYLVCSLLNNKVKK